MKRCIMIDRDSGLGGDSRESSLRWMIGREMSCDANGCRVVRYDAGQGLKQLMIYIEQ